jgi:AcrR family transcriptional regulator
MLSVVTVNKRQLLSHEPMTQRKPYHHGNLREALLQSAIRLIREVGPMAFTLREVARRAGVSHNAPYRHFRNKEEMIAAVATEGYQELTAAMAAAAKEQADALNRLKYAGLAYIRFALRRPEHFTVMFEAPFSEQQHPDAARAAKEAFSTLVSLVEECQEKKRLPSGDAGEYALLAWSMVHGIAKLAITGRLPYRGTADVMKFAAFVIDQSLPRRG